MKSIPSLQSLLFELQKLPGVGPRSAQRLAQYFLRTNEKDIQALSQSLLDIKTKIKKCTKCFNFTEEELCSVCSDSYRQTDVLCIVEQPFDLLRIENCNVFRGCYHVLHGSLSPLNNIHPKHLTLLELHKRIKEESIKELILAIDFDLEGDTTALYIMNMVKEHSLKMTRLASGIPFGSDLDYVDAKTLGQAIVNRNSL